MVVIVSSSLLHALILLLVQLQISSGLVLASDCNVQISCGYVCKIRRLSVNILLTDILVLIRVGVYACVSVPGMEVSNYPVASPRPHKEKSGLTWMRLSRSSQGTLPWTR